MTLTDVQMLRWGPLILTSQTAKNQLSLRPTRQQIFAGSELQPESATDSLLVNDTAEQRLLMLEANRPSQKQKVDVDKKCINVGNQLVFHAPKKLFLAQGRCQLKLTNRTSVGCSTGGRAREGRKWILRIVVVAENERRDNESGRGGGGGVC